MNTPTIATTLSLNADEARQCQIALAERIHMVTYHGVRFDADYWQEQLEQCQAILAKLDRLFGTHR